MALALLLGGSAIGCLVASNAPPPKALLTNRDGVAAVIPCPIFPASNIWNTAIDQLPADDNSNTLLSTMDANGHLRAGFGSGRTGSDPGIPYAIINENTKRVQITLQEAEESDKGPYPLPDNPPLSSDGRLSVLDVQSCYLYEMSGLHRDADGQWAATSAAIFDLRSQVLRRSGFISADGAGLPIFPGLARYEEVAAGSIAHALRFTTQRTRKMFLWPARHSDSNIYDFAFPPMGTRLRLKSTFHINDFDPQTRVILHALQIYGMVVADNGPAWTISGAPDKRWNEVQLAELEKVPASAFEVVDVTPLMADQNLGLARQDVVPAALPTKSQQNDARDFKGAKEQEAVTSPSPSSGKSKAAPRP